MKKLQDWASVTAFAIFTLSTLILILRGIAPKEWLFFSVTILVPSPLQNAVVRMILGEVLKPGTTLSIPPPPGLPTIPTISYPPEIREQDRRRRDP